MNNIPLNSNVTTRLDVHYYYEFFKRKTPFVMQNFGIWGLVSVGIVKILLPKLPKHGWFHEFKSLFVQIRSRFFFCRRAYAKRDTAKSQSNYISSTARKFTSESNLTKIGFCVVVTDIIEHTKFGNNRSREYKVMKGRILPCFLGMACRINNAVARLCYMTLWLRFVIPLRTCCVWRRWMPRHALLVRLRLLRAPWTLCRVVAILWLRAITLSTVLRVRSDLFVIKGHWPVTHHEHSK